MIPHVHGIDNASISQSMGKGEATLLNPSREYRPDSRTSGLLQDQVEISGKKKPEEQHADNHANEVQQDQVVLSSKEKSNTAATVMTPPQLVIRRQPASPKQEAEEIIRKQPLQKLKSVLIEDPTYQDELADSDDEDLTPTEPPKVSPSVGIEKIKRDLKTWNMLEARMFQESDSDEEEAISDQDNLEPKMNDAGFKNNDSDLNNQEALRRIDELNNMAIAFNLKDRQELRKMKLEIRKNALKTLFQNYQNRKHRLQNIDPIKRERILDEVRLGTEQTRQFQETSRLGYNDIISNTFSMDSGPQSSWILQDKMVVDRTKDRALRRWLISPSVQALKNTISEHSTKEDELLYLGQLKDVLLKAYGKVSQRDALDIFSNITSLKSQYGEAGSEMLLGTTISAGAGVCRHRSLAAKVLVDEIGEGKVHAALIGGTVPTIDKENNSTRGHHIWNTIKMPSGNEYILDAMHDRIVDMSDPAQQDWISNFYQSLEEGEHREVHNLAS